MRIFAMNLKDLWIKSLQELSKDVKRVNLITWFRNTAVLEAKEGKVVIGLPLPTFLSWHESKFKDQTLKALQAVDSSVKEVEYKVELALAEDERTIDVLKHFVDESTPRKLPNRPEVKFKDGTVAKQVHSRYTLENYIVSDENKLAHAACSTVAKYPGQNYSPLFIYGGVGLGKTHLLQAVGNEIKKNDPTKKVVYTTTENFTNEVIQGIKTKNMESFRRKYRTADVLIIDDVQFIANKDRTQEELFHTFNALHEAGKQIILSADKAPHELKLLSERLISRFGSGMAVDVKMPDIETRLAILQSKTQEAQVIIEPNVLETIATKVNSSVRALEGVLTRVIAEYELAHITPTVDSVEKLIGGTQQKGQLQKEVQEVPVVRCHVTLESLLDHVSGHYGVAKEAILGASRQREFMVPRQVTMYLAKYSLNIPLSKIGMALGNRNHATVIHATTRIAERLQFDRQLLRDINAIKKEAGL